MQAENDRRRARYGEASFAECRGCFGLYVLSTEFVGRLRIKMKKSENIS